MIDQWVPAEQLRAEGAERRLRTPVEDLARPIWLDRDRGDAPIEILTADDHDRVPALLPIRTARMAQSPYGFLRGAAAVMAADLAGGADTGLYGQICGDAHAANFGLYASPERRLVMDVNDFDEAGLGPWDWDLKRLVASLVCAGRVAGVDEQRCRAAAAACSRAYRAGLAELASLPLLDAHYLTTDRATLEHHGISDLVETFDRVQKKARKNTSRKVASKLTGGEPEDDAWRFVEDPPLLTRPDADEAERVVASLAGYRETLSEEIRALFARYAVMDVAHRVVGLGSVGYRNYVVLLRGNGDEALVMQVKQARPASLAAHLPQPPVTHQGERVVHGQRWMQTVSDLLLGWTTIAGRPYLVRQFRDMKGSIDPSELPADQLDDYARVVGVVLARAHAQSIDARLLSGYCDAGSAGDPGCAAGEAFDDAFAGYAVRYADQTEADHAALLTAVRTGRLSPPLPTGRLNRPARTDPVSPP